MKAPGFWRRYKERSFRKREKRKAENGKKFLFSLYRPSSFVAEQFKIIRTMVLRSGKDRACRTLLITSALPEEGKTFVSSNLAVSMAQSVSDQVVLIDSDLRNPSLHLLFGIGREREGLTTFCAKDIKVTDVLYRTHLQNLLFMPAGLPSDKNMEGLSTEKLQRLIRDIRQLHKDCFVIFDTGPVQLLADSLMISDLVDGVILVVRIGDTKREVLDKTINTLQERKIIGVVLNYCKVPKELYHGYHRYYAKAAQVERIAGSFEKE